MQELKPSWAFVRWLCVGVACASLMTTGVTAQSATLTVLASFAGTNGSSPWPGPIIQGSDGNFYGTTLYGGASTNQGPLGGVGYGTVFRVTPDGVLTCLASFMGTNGINPTAGLVEGIDGDFYGSTWYGGAYNLGTLFRVATNGLLTTLVSFDGTNGAWPRASMVRGRDGAMYGTARRGGVSYNDPRAVSPYGLPPGNGCIFKLTTNGDFSLLYSFTPDTEGSEPMTSLTLARDGNFYGIAHGGSNGWDLVFKMTLQGALSPVADLNPALGSAGFANLIEGRDGWFYAMAQSGTNPSGGILRVSASGVQQNLVLFTNYEVAGRSFGAPVEGTDGCIYGVLSGDSPWPNYNSGSVFQLAPSGTLTTICQFGFTNGAWPTGGMIQGKDGAFYGTTMYGGAYTNQIGANCGTVYRLNIPSAAAPKLSTPSRSGDNVTLSWSAIPSRTYQVQCASKLGESNWTDVGATITADTTVAGISDPSTPGDIRYYRVILLP